MLDNLIWQDALFYFVVAFVLFYSGYQLGKGFATFALVLLTTCFIGVGSLALVWHQ